MQPEERQKRIEEHLQKVEFVSLDELAEKLGASVSTVRRDVTVLEAAGTVKRTHGGARLANLKSDEFTFANRDTAIDVAPIAFTPNFTEQGSTLAQWTAFRNKLPNTECPATLSTVVTFLAGFLLPIARALASGESFDRHWSPGGPWSA